MKYQIYPDARFEWRWRLWADNNRIIANSGEGYRNKSDCKAAINLVKSSHSAHVVE